MSKYTPWFPFSTPPGRPGVYNVSCRDADQTGRWYGRFDGSKWSFWERAGDSNASHRRAIKEAGKKGCVHVAPIGTWRGLADEPKP